MPDDDACDRAGRAQARCTGARCKAQHRVQQQVAARFGIRSIPTLAVFKDGREVKRQAGAVNYATLVDWLRSALPVRCLHVRYHTSERRGKGREDNREKCWCHRSLLPRLCRRDLSRTGGVLVVRDARVAAYVVGGVLVATAAIAFCPLYRIIGFGRGYACAVGQRPRVSASSWRG